MKVEPVSVVYRDQHRSLSPRNHLARTGEGSLLVTRGLPSNMGGDLW